MSDLTPNGIKPFRFGWRLGIFRSRLWGLSWILWTIFYCMPLVTGWLLKLVFDRMAESESINDLVLYIGDGEAVTWVVFAAAIYFVVRWWVIGMTLLRTNMLHAQTVSGGPRAATLPASPAEAITRFHDDARDALVWSDSWLDGAASVIYAIGALTVMASINVRAALVALLPLAVVTVMTRSITPRLYAARADDRAAASGVTSFLGEIFAGQLAFGLAGRERQAVARLEEHTSIRRRTAVRDTVLQEAVDGFASSTADCTIGVTLLVLVPAVRSGDFSVGDLALFVTYAVPLAQLPRYLARLITAREQAVVSFERMGEMVAPGRLDDLFDHRPITIESNDTMLTRELDPERVPLDRLEVRNLTATYASTGGGARDVSFVVERGTFTVITGPVGSGKSTLLQALVGLVPFDDGVVLWNGEEIEDPAAWFVPPQAAYLPQIPRLFSESLVDNITLGRDRNRLDDVLEFTRLTSDLDEMPNRGATMVGARGLRLSGGQAQRVATARSLLPQPELLLVDDLSSALDVTTERELWTRLRADGSSTVIAVSHRQLALEFADQVIVLS